jgi:hypothetical protein
VIRSWGWGSLLGCIGLLNGCNSDVPVSAITRVTPPGFTITVTRVATHPFLSRFNLALMVSTAGGCSTTSELFPDTGGVSRRNLYLGTSDRLYVVGQFDVRRFDPQKCLIELIEFRSVEGGLKFIGSFDIEPSGQWVFQTASTRSERPFEPL